MSRYARQTLHVFAVNLSLLGSCFVLCALLETVRF